MLWKPFVLYKLGISYQATNLNKGKTANSLVWFKPLECFFGSEGHVTLDRNPGPGYDTLLLRMIPGDLLSVFPHRHIHTLPGLLDSWAALPNSYPNACMPMQGGNLYHFYDGLWYDPAESRTHDLPCERRTRYRLSQPDTVLQIVWTLKIICFSQVSDPDHWTVSSLWTESLYEAFVFWVGHSERQCLKI